MKMKKVVVFLGLAMGLLPLAQAVGSVTVVADPGTIYSTTAMTGFQTLGDDMDGTLVTVTFANGSTGSAAFATTGSGTGAATAGSWSLSVSGDTFNVGAWTLSNTNTDPLLGIAKVVIDGKTGKTTFDRTLPSPGTDGSASGRDFDFDTNAFNFDVTATYRDQLALSGNGPVGDQYTTLQLAFKDAFTGRLVFSADADNGTTDIIKVPEPVTLALLGMGLAGIGLTRRRSQAA